RCRRASARMSPGSTRSPTPTAASPAIQLSPCATCPPLYSLPTAVRSTLRKICRASRSAATIGRPGRCRRGRSCTCTAGGGRAAADADGWPESGCYPGQVQHSVYDNGQPGTLLWYHDHAMAITRLNVYAGLAGLYIIRDPQEHALQLPRGADDHELLLLVQ